MLPHAVEGAEGEMRFRCALSLLVGMFIAMPAWSEPQLNVIKLKLANSGGQEFLCVSPYTISQCEEQVAKLRSVLDRCNAKTLGKWTWVLIRSEDWKQILGCQLQLNINSPAFINLQMRQTFFRGCLIRVEATATDRITRYMAYPI